MCQHLTSRDETMEEAKRVLADADHPAWMGALKWATENGYGPANQKIELTMVHPDVRERLQRQVAAIRSSAHVRDADALLTELHEVWS
jgi:hypothetical protein